MLGKCHLPFQRRLEAVLLIHPEHAAGDFLALDGICPHVAADAVAGHVGPGADALAERAEVL